MRRRRRTEQVAAVAAERDSGVAVRVGIAVRGAATAVALEAERGLAAAVRARVEVVAAMAT
jgi:hypothetical protein